MSAKFYDVQWQLRDRPISGNSPTVNDQSTHSLLHDQHRFKFFKQHGDVTPNSCSFVILL